jgi:hypothetical protein
MNAQQKAAYVFAQAVCALAEVEGMKAENRQREYCGNAMAYGYEEFMAVIERYGIHHNAVCNFFDK